MHYSKAMRQYLWENGVSIIKDFTPQCWVDEKGPWGDRRPVGYFFEEVYHLHDTTVLILGSMGYKFEDGEGTWDGIPSSTQIHVIGPTKERAQEVLEEILSVPNVNHEAEILPKPLNII